MKPDALHIIEAAYDVDSDDVTWLKRLAEVTNLAIGGGRGVIANTYDVSLPGPIRIDATESGLKAGFFDFFMGTSKQLDDDYIRRSYLSSTACALTSEFGGWSNLPFVKSGELGHWDVADDLILRGWVPGGIGVTLNCFQPKTPTLSRARRAHLSRLASHVGAGYRLRRKLAERGSKDERVEAILDTNGVVQHAEGAAISNGARTRLKEAVHEMERARGKLRAEDPEQAVVRWQALVGARWSLVDEFREGSRRYIVAYANELKTGAPETVTPRERQVVAYAVAGHWNKLIAYDLGIAPSTVRVLLSRAMAKLGVKSQAELARLVATWPIAKDDTKNGL
jgi:DNA-binding CsgD family transcriptional regulator